MLAPEMHVRDLGNHLIDWMAFAHINKKFLELNSASRGMFRVTGRDNQYRPSNRHSCNLDRWADCFARERSAISRHGRPKFAFSTAATAVPLSSTLRDEFTSSIGSLTSPHSQPRLRDLSTGWMHHYPLNMEKLKWIY